MTSSQGRMLLQGTILKLDKASKGFLQLKPYELQVQSISIGEETAEVLALGAGFNRTFHVPWRLLEGSNNQ